MGHKRKAKKRRRTNLTQNNGTFQRAIARDFLDICTQIRENLKRKVAQRFIGALDLLAGIAGCETDTEVVAHALVPVVLLGGSHFGGVSVFGKGVEVGDERADVRVVGVRLEAKLVFEGDGKGEEEVD